MWGLVPGSPGSHVNLYRTAAWVCLGSERLTQQRGTSKFGMNVRTRRNPDLLVEALDQETGSFMDIELPPVFDPAYYRSGHPELQALGDEDLRNHWKHEGLAAGLDASPAARREWFAERLIGDFDVLEIGPFDSPVLVGPRIKYFDVLDQASLEERARSLGRNGSVPNIDFVGPNGDLAKVPRESADVVLSCHSLEHAPDLVRHFNHIGDILRDDGLYVAIVPDKRYCFDHFVPFSTIGQVLQAHCEARTAHTLNSVIEHRAMTTHNDAVRHWNGDHGRPGLTPVRISAAVDEYVQANGAYLDVHAWQFGPAQFESVTHLLAELDYISLSPVRVYKTIFPRLEFVAVMRKRSAQ